MNVAPNVEIIRQWLSTGFLGAILLVLMYGLKPLIEFFIRTRELRLQEKKDDRQGYGDLIDTLTEQVREFRTEVQKLSGENKQLRDEVRDLHTVIDGMRRENLAGNISLQREVISLLPPERVTPEIRHALKVLDELQPAFQVRSPSPEPPKAARAGRRRPRQ